VIRIGRAKRCREKKRRSRTTQEKAIAQSNAQFHMQSRNFMSSLCLWAHPPDPDPNFGPFYDRALSGDLGALVDFYCGQRFDPGAAFYQCIGFLAARGTAEETKKIVEKIISINIRGGPQRTGSGRKASIREEERRLLPAAKLAAVWISRRRKRDRAESCPRLNRELLWQEYIDHNLPIHTPGIQQSLEIGIEAQNGTNPSTESRIPTAWSAEGLRDLVLTPDSIQTRNRGFRSYITEAGLAHGIAPKELFLDLARTTPSTLSPSIAVRRFARKLFATRKRIFLGKLAR
jgi:hypothetical protein